MRVLDPAVARYVAEVPVLVVGAGACGLTAALASTQGGADVLVLERDATPLGTTAMSTGLIPGAGSRLQRAAGVADTPAVFAADLLRKTRGQTDEKVANALALASAGTIEWLVDAHDVPLSFVDSFLYPGHSVMRMHGTPNRSGAELMHALQAAAARSDVDILTEARVTHLFAGNDRRVAGARLERPDGYTEDVGCSVLILACCGFAGNTARVAELMPEAADAEFYGHPGNTGDAIDWGQELGAGLADLASFQGHAGLAKGHGVPILWPVIVEGGIQVNLDGRRFADESRGYSEQTLDVLAQPEHVAFTVYDQRLHELMQEFDDYREAEQAGAIRCGSTLAELCEVTGLPEANLVSTLQQVAASVKGGSDDLFGRVFASREVLTAPYYAVKVTGALFHTQGGLVVDTDARVLTPDRQRFPNLYAGGGAARGISGPSCWGYMAGNGLLTATTFGRLAGEAAAAQTAAAAA